jgi:hypothetical protein
LKKKISVAAFAEKVIGQGEKRLIVVPALISDIRRTIPHCEHTHEELSRLISVIAVSRSCSLSFMRPEGFEVNDLPAAPRARSGKPAGG